MSATKGTTKSGGQKHIFDKFYTRPEIANFCLDKLDLSAFDVIIEPSAGNGAFSSKIPGCIAYDIAPEAEHVIEKNWFDVNLLRTKNEKILVVGNPPFGQQNTLALQFINHAAKFADVIAFVLPKSFLKESIQRRIDPNFHLQTSFTLPQNSFHLGIKEVDVPCVFQIWKYEPHLLRKVSPKVETTIFDFVKKHENPDAYVQRVGGNAGRAGLDWHSRSEQSNYFIRLKKDSNISLEKLIQVINSTSFADRDNSVGPRSLSKQEFLRSLSQRLGE